MEEIRGNKLTPISLSQLGRDSVDRPVVENTKGLDTATFRVQRDVMKAIEASRKARLSLLNSLDSEYADQFNACADSLGPLGKIALERSNLQSDETRLDGTRETLEQRLSDGEDIEHTDQELKRLTEEEDALAIKIDALDGDMQKYIDRLCETYKQLAINKLYFKGWFSLCDVVEELRAISIRFAEEQLLNCCLNRHVYRQSVRHFLTEYQTKILSVFYSGSADLSGVSFELVEPELKSANSGLESHNRGKYPLKITFAVLKGAPLCSIYIKPRDARIDARIIQLFDELNQLVAQNQAGAVNLPVYRIHNPPYAQQSFSLWEYIDGVHLPGTSAEQAIKELENNAVKEHLAKQLLWLESVCRYISLSDLSRENILFAALGSKHPKIVPIDLESIQPGKPTGLYSSNPEVANFTAEEEVLLKGCVDELSQFPFRYVPIATSHFLGGLTRCDSYVSMAARLKQSLLDSGYQLLASVEELESLVLTDFLHNDVPYLWEFKGHVYYGTIDEKNAIARKEEVK